MRVRPASLGKQQTHFCHLLRNLLHDLRALLHQHCGDSTNRSIIERRRGRGGCDAPRRSAGLAQARAGCLNTRPWESSRTQRRGCLISIAAACSIGTKRTLLDCTSRWIDGLPSARTRKSASASPLENDSSAAWSVEPTKRKSASPRPKCSATRRND